jgi:hypothetical protein
MLSQHDEPQEPPPMTERRRKLAPSRPEPLDHINRMRADILAQIARDIPPRLHAESLGVLAQELLMQAAHQGGQAYARGWLDVIEAHLRSDIPVDTMVVLAIEAIGRIQALARAAVLRFLSRWNRDATLSDMTGTYRLSADGRGAEWIGQPDPVVHLTGMVML